MAARRARVLHVLPDLAIGGGQTIVLNHVRHADRTRFDVDVVQLHPAADLAPAFAEAGSPPELLASPPSPRTVAELRRRVRRSDVVHVHSDEDRKLAQLASLRTGVPVVGHLHAEWVHLGAKIPAGASAPRRLRGQALGAARDAIERRTVAHYVAESVDVARLFRPLVTQPITVLRQAIPVDRFEGAAERADDTGLAATLRLGRGPVLVNVSRMVPGKGHLHLVEAFRAVLDAEPSATLVLVGDGTERPAVEARAAELGVTDALRVLGNRHDVPEILSLADVFVFASESEGFGLAVLEAMAATKPVVAFRLPAIEEFASDGESALLVQRGDVPAFTAAVQKVLADPALGAALGRAGRATVERRFPADAVARTFEQVYDEVLATRRKRGRG
jgi:glycosyltransferase involved in cell wall biosynthesis